MTPIYKHGNKDMLKIYISLIYVSMFMCIKFQAICMYTTMTTLSKFEMFKILCVPRNITVDK